jgi:hypothetical protein
VKDHVEKEIAKVVDEVMVVRSESGGTSAEFDYRRKGPERSRPNDSRTQTGYGAH